MNKQDPRYKKLQTLLRDMRIKQGVTQQELAYRLGRPQSFVSKLESGERNIDLIELIDLLKQINLDANSVSNICALLDDS